MSFYPLLLALHFFLDIPSTEEPEQTYPLAQNYTYLGEGAQIMAFVSEDQSHVLKIFKARHEKPFKWKRWVKRHSPEKQRASALKWGKKFQETKERTTLAYEIMPEQTGLLFLHFEKTPSPQKACMIDKRGKAHTIDLSQLPYMVQKKAELVPDRFNRLIKSGNLEEAKLAIQNLYILFAEKQKKGLTDPRQTLSKNYGFVGDNAIQIDVGKIERGSKSHPEKIALYMKKNFPSLSAFCDAVQPLESDAFQPQSQELLQAP